MSENRQINNEENDLSAADASPRREGGSLAIRFIIGLCILAVAGFVSYKWMSDRPKATRKHRETKAALVETTAVKTADHDVTIRAMGTVVPARILDITSRASGEIVSVSKEFFPGGYLKKGDIVVKVDKEDYKLLLEEAEFALEKAALSIIQSELAIEQSVLAIEQSSFAIDQRKADITKAEKDLALEKGQQKIAKREYEVLGEKISESDEELVLRMPQLRAAEAALESAKSRLLEAQAAKKYAEANKKFVEAAMKSAEAAKDQTEIAIEKAGLHLKRTDIRAPFNAVIQSNNVEIGSQVTTGTPIARLIDSDEYWIEVSIPVDRLKWIKIPNMNETKGSDVRITSESGWGSGAFRIGSVKRLMTEVESEGRMAVILVSVNDPLSLKNADNPKMILGSYLRVEIEGNSLSDVVRVSRTSLHDNNRVWIAKPDSTLDVREVEIIWSDSGYVYVTNSLGDDELLITSDLAAPVQGMAIRLSETKSPVAPPSAEESGEEDSIDEKDKDEEIR